jgi:hypothetical protein
MVMPNPNGAHHEQPDKSVTAPHFLAKVAQGAAVLHSIAATQSECECPQCRLSSIQARVSAFMMSETLRAAVTGDRSGLQKVAALVEEIESKRSAG